MEMKGEASSSADAFHSNTTNKQTYTNLRYQIFFKYRESSKNQELLIIGGCTGASFMLVLLAGVLRYLVNTIVNCSNF